MLSDRLRQLRRQMDITQEELAAKAGINRSYLSVIENGRSSPTLDIIERLALGLGVSLWTLLSEVEDKHFTYDSEEEFEMIVGLREFLEDSDEMLLTQPSGAEIEELKRIVFKGQARPDKRFFRDALLAIRRSGKSNSSKV